MNFIQDLRYETKQSEAFSSDGSRLQNGDIVLSGSSLIVSGKELLIQLLDIKFKWFQAEYAYDTDYGIPYFQEILGQKKLDIYDVFALLTSKIEEESDVKK